MLLIREIGAAPAPRSIDEVDLAFLREHLESASATATEYYVDRSTIDALTTAHAPESLLTHLNALLGELPAVDVEVLDGDERGRMTPVAFSSSPLRLQLLPDLLTPMDVPAPFPAHLEQHPDAVPTAIAAEVGEAVIVDGRTLLCVVCASDGFRVRRTKTHPGLAAFFGSEWIDLSAECYICTACGYVHWFMREQPTSAP